MNKVTICENTLEPSTWKTHEVEDVRSFLLEQFHGVWPKGAHIYLDYVCQKSDITPYDANGVERLGKLSGHFYVVIYPQGVETILIVVAIAIAAVAIGLSFLLRPTPAAEQTPQWNDILGKRQNRSRPNERITDIFGQLWTTFDLLAVPYTIFVNNQEIEYCYMCIGRGQYQIEQINGIYQIRDDATPLAEIDGASAEIFGPNTSPNVGSPQLTIGAAIAEPLRNVQSFDIVNGQLLQAPNVNSWVSSSLGGGTHNIRMYAGGVIENDTGGSIDFTWAFSPGDTLYFGGALPNDGLAYDSAGIQPPVDLGGIYQISYVTSTQITLDSPNLVNPNWNLLSAFGGGVSQYRHDTSNFMANNPFWIGGFAAGPTPVLPFFLAHPEVTEVWCNFVASQGSYKVRASDGVQFEVDNTVQLGVTPCDAYGNPTGVEILYSINLLGSHTDRAGKGITLKASITPGPGGILIRGMRTTFQDMSTSGGSPIYQVSDAIQWRDCFFVSPLTVSAFGDVTTIQTAIRATPSAIAIRDRKLNGLVTRMVPVPSGGALAASTNAADILCAMALDPYIGNMEASQIDIAGIYAIAGPGGTIQDYFNMYPDATLPTQFCYAFIDSTISFEESVAQMAASIFCVGYRRGGLLSLSFEQKTPDSTLLFNHRNKIPKSETRTVTFGTLSGNDGINLVYVEPNAPNYPYQDTPTTLYFPPGASSTLPGSATNPKTITTIGIRNVQQATTLGWRLYWKLIAQNTTVQFDCTEEAALMVLQDRILVADNTRDDTQDGEVIDQASLLLTLSQNVDFDSDFEYSIFLQHPDETIENIPISAGGAANEVLLAYAPSVPCVTDDNLYAKTTYLVVSNAPVRSAAFLVAEKTAKAGKTWEVKAVNYDDLYYSQDHLFSTFVDVAGMFSEVILHSPKPVVDVAGLFLEVITPVPPANIDVAGLFTEVVIKPAALPGIDVAGLFLESVKKSVAPNVDIAGLFMEPVIYSTLPNVDIASLFLEPVTKPVAPNVDVAGLFIEVITR